MATMTYAGTGVNYSAMDPFKRRAQLAARETSGNVALWSGGEFRAVEASRGESAFLIEAPDCFIAHVEEGLGTKNLVADAMYALTGKSYHDHIAQCAMAMIANDMATLGARLLSAAMHLAVGDARWFNDEKRLADLIAGWKKACNLARCVWGGGETPTLKGVVVPNTIVLSGSAVGVVKPKERLITGQIQPGDAIVIVESSGIHANGLTLAREIGERIDTKPTYFPKGFPRLYLKCLSDGRTYGETLLDPTHIYVGLVEDCLNAGVNIHYAVNITGHGWRKLMRATQPFTYIIEVLPTELPIFRFIQEHGPVDDREAYGNFNMGAGFALYVTEAQATQVIDIAEKLGLRAFIAGYIESGDKRVVIKPKNLVFPGETLAVR
jgi:phosphoribosylformylglycinamidine cyclo-ligase